MQLAGYELGARISRNDIVTVYLGEKVGFHSSSAPPVVIKLLSKSVLVDDVVRQSFERRARLATAIANPYIVPVLKSGITPQNRAYFVMSNIEGIDLSAVIARDTLFFPRRLGICLQICQALIYAHRNGILHSGLDSSKVLLDKFGQAHVSDFDVGMLVAESRRIVIAAAQNAPSRLLKKLSAAGVKADIYALGLLMYELLSGSPINSMRYQPAAANVAGFSPELDKLLQECLDKNPVNRPASVQLIYEKLLHISAGNHLSDAQKQRAADCFQKKNCLLLDVIKENSESAVYIFEESGCGRLLVIKKRSVNKGGYKEAQRLLHIKHPNLAEVIAVVRHDSSFVVATEYLAGGTLADRLLTSWEVQQFFTTARGVAAGLAFALKHGVHHSQLRPGSIYFDEHNNAKLADFAFESDSGSDAEAEDTAYISKAITESEQADVFSLGVLFHEMLLGKKPQFDKGAIKLSLRLRNLPKELQSLLLRMLDVKNKLACKHMTDVVRDLAQQQSEADAVMRARIAFSNKNSQNSAILLPWVVGAALCLIAGILFVVAG